MSRPLALPRGRAVRAGLAVFALAVSFVAVRTAAAFPTVGFVENFTAAGTAGWTSGAQNSNPGTGGIGGFGDGYLRVARTGFAAQLGSHNADSTYGGDYLSANATKIKFSLNDVGTNQNLEIHFQIGNTSSFWLYTPGFIPPEGSWAEFEVDLTDTASFVNIIDFTGQTYSEALTVADRVSIRHDVAPFTQTPNAIIGDFGIDGFKIEGGPPVGVDPLRPTRGKPLALAAPFPNPSRGNAVFSFETFDADPVTIAIVDAAGRMVRRARVETGAAGRHAWTWDGRDDSGRLTAAGVYRVRAYGPAGGMSRPIVRID